MAVATSAAAPTSDDRPSSSRPARRGSDLVPALAVGVAYGVAMALWYPYRDVFSFDSDEGINAILAVLVDRGDALYTRTWYNQPPLLTHGLVLWFNAFGWDIDSGRMMILLSAALGLFALYEVVRMSAGHGAAAIASLLLATSAYFPRLSLSLMQAVPSLVLALLALWALFRWQCGGRRVWIGAAGVLMGCALACKLTTAVLLPAFAVWLAMVAPRTVARAVWRPALQWLVCTGVTTAVLLLLLVGPSHLPLLASSHVAARRAALLTDFGALGLLLTGFSEWPLTLLGLGGYVLIARWRMRLAAVFPLWAAIAAAAMLVHAPIWYHHQLLLSVPNAAAGGIAVAELLRRNSALARVPAAALPPLRIAAVALLIALPLWSAYGARLPAPTPLSGAADRVVNTMRELAPAGTIVVGNEPMYAFRAGSVMPAAIAVLPLLRVTTDPDLAEAIQVTFAEPAPEQVVLMSGVLPELRGWIVTAMAERYRLVVDEPEVQLYVLKGPRVQGF